MSITTDEPRTARRARGTGAPLPRVAVIGGGIAGLSAAQVLLDAGLAVQVIDRGDRPGGRCSTRRDGAHAFDHGAQYFTVRDARFAAALAHPWRAGLVARWPGTVVALAHGQSRPLAPVTRYVGVSGMGALADGFAAGLPIAAGVTVAAALPGPGDWQLVGTTGAELGSYAAVVLAMPPEQAMRVMSRRGPLRRRLGEQCSAPCWALLLSFDARLPLAFDGAFVDDPVLGWIARDSTKPGRPDGERWVVHATPAWSATRLHLDAQRVAGELLAAFWHVTALSPLTPGYRRAHRWALARPDAAASGEFYDDALALAVCGDWCRGGRIEGAWLSGSAAGAHLAARLAPQARRVLGSEA
ncbi:MAG: NAD(P)-binding protein [Gammaproteobacteria bacterium]